ncbi:ATP-binding protein [Streptomyces sp. NBC_01429]|uniref:ATP-binding protein n=1 Tax=Streptomyces sp. NBC_01429 TaxID=2903862 RepID=UPI002E2C790D|nr:ATP-binding protein [Streptomyces sp. NBC_01429]
MEPSRTRPAVTELRLSAFTSHRGAAFPLGPLTLFTGASGSGKTTALRAYESLARLGAGAPLGEAFPDAAACVPERAAADAQGRRGFRIGCTVDGPAGPVRLDLAVQAEPELRIVGERLTGGDQTLLATALRDPGRRTVQAAWHTAGAVPVTRAPLPDDRLGTALLPLRVAGRTQGQLRVLAAAEQAVLALRSVLVCDPQPQLMRRPVAAGRERLGRGCENLPAVLDRLLGRALDPHGALLARLAAAARAGCAGPVTELAVERLADGTVRALLARDDSGVRAATPLERLGEGELRYLALALVLLTGVSTPGVVRPAGPGEVDPALRSLTVLADGFDRSLDRRQARELLSLAAGVCAEGGLRLVGTVADASCVRGTAGATVVDLTP